MQKNTKKFLPFFILFLGFLFTSSSSSATALTAGQMEAITALVRSFGADEAVVKNVQASLDGSTVSKAAQNASRAAVPANKPVFSNQGIAGDIDPTPDTSSCVALTTNLRYRSRDAQTGGQVSLLQDFLQSRGFLMSEPTGFFGLLSFKAVKDFQKSVGIEPTGYVGVLTRAKIKELSCGSIVPLPTPLPIPIPVPTPVPSSLEVISPNGGESWQKGTTQLIRWAQRSVSTSPASPAETSAVSGNTSLMPPISPNTVNISLTSYTPPCTVGPCPAMPSAIYLIASNAPNFGEYRWTVGATTNSNTTIPDGAYLMQVCAGGQCDQSNSYFKIFSQSGGNLPPVIDGVSGPTVLDVGQLGTWSVRAHDPENGPLSYMVNWGDDVSSGSAGGGAAPMSISASQTTTFTHNYSRAGTYKVSFTVTDNKGLSAQSTISVQVGPVQSLSYTVSTDKETYTQDEKIPITIKAWNNSSEPKTLRFSTGCQIAYAVAFYDSSVGQVCTQAPTEVTIPANGVRLWAITHNPVDYRIPVGGYKLTGKVLGFGEANTPVTIVAPTTQPSITVLSPNGGEVWQKGVSQTVLWSTNGISSTTTMTVRFRSVSTGEEFLVNNVPNLGYSTGVIPEDFATGDYKAEVKTAVNSQSYSDSSDSYFTITAAQTIPIKSISIDASNNVHLSFSQQASACLQLKDSQGNYFALNSSQLSYSCANSTLFTGYQTELTIPQSSFARTIIAGQYYQVCNADTRGNSYAVCSNPTLVTAATQPSITVLSPNGGESFTLNADGRIAVNYKLTNAKGPIYFYLLNSSGTVVSTQSTEKGDPNGANTFYFPIAPAVSSVSVNNQYKFKVCDQGSDIINPACDSSDSYFTITSATQPLVVSSSEIIGSQTTYTSGQTIKFSIRGMVSNGTVGGPAMGFNVQSAMYITNPKETVQINGEYQSFNANYNPNTALWDVTMTAPSDTSKTYTIDSVFYCSYSSLCASGQINKSFTFTIQPLTNEQIINNLVNVLKKCAVETPPLRCLDFDLNGNGFITGADINMLKGLSLLSETNLQSVRDKILAAVEKSQFTKVGDALFDHLLDVDGNGVINITDIIKIRNALNSTRPSITVVSPNGGENWQKGTTQTIRWSGNIGGSVNISLSNYLSCWESNPACMAPAVLYQIASNASGSSYNWTVGKAQNGGDIPAGQYKVTVSSATSPAVTDQSNSAFTITEITIQSTDSSLNPETVSALAEFSQKKNLNLASILAAIAQLIEAFK